jgi:cell division septum initiation protein DivIVA
MEDERVDKLLDIIIKQNRENTVLLDDISSLEEEVEKLKRNLCAWQAAATGGKGEKTQPFIIS